VVLGVIQTQIGGEAYALMIIQWLWQVGVVIWKGCILYSAVHCCFFSSQKMGLSVAAFAAKGLNDG
jgi:hypothetical protein